MVSTTDSAASATITPLKPSATMAAWRTARLSCRPGKGITPSSQGAPVLLMAVNPGFAGQKYIPSTTGKIREVRRILDEAGREDAEIEVDGNVSLPNARIMRAAGADLFVAGTSSVFLKDGRIAQHLAELREACR